MSLAAIVEFLALFIGACGVVYGANQKIERIQAEHDMDMALNRVYELEAELRDGRVR